MRYFIFFLYAFVILCSCQRSKNKSRFSAYKVSFKKEVILSPHKDNNLLIGSIAAITVDKNSNIYVLDRNLYRVEKFSKEGDTMGFLGKGKGKGPGEFMGPIDLAVDSVGNVYVLDRVNAKISIFNQRGKVLNEVVLDFVPGRMVVDKDQNIYVIGFPFSYSGPTIKKYSKVAKGDYKLIKSFCKRSEEAKTREVKMSGSVDRMAIGSDGYLYYSFFYPYEIRKYSLAGKLITTFKRSKPPFSKPRISSKGMVVFDGGNRDVIPLKGNLLISRMFHRTPENKWTFSMDIFHHGVFQEHITDKALGLPAQSRYVASDHKNAIYIGSNVPKPQVVKLMLK